jgi:hypothetical protein
MLLPAAVFVPTVVRLWRNHPNDLDGTGIITVGRFATTPDPVFD